MKVSAYEIMILYRFSSTASTVEYVTNVLIVLIITAGYERSYLLGIFHFYFIILMLIFYWTSAVA